MCHLLSVPHMLSMCIEQDNSFTTSGPNAQHTTCFGCISTVSFHVQWPAARPGDLGMVVMQSPGVGLLQSTRDSSNLPYLPDHAVTPFVSPHHIPPSARLPIPTAGCSEIPFHSPFQRREEFVPESNQQSIPFFNKKIYREFNCLHCSVGCTILQLISKGSHSLSYFILILITH